MRKDALGQRAAIKDVQKLHIFDNDWADIGYNYIIDTYGHIYAGRDPQYIGSHVQGKNSGSLGILMLGYYGDVGMTPAAKQSLCDLIQNLSAKHNIPIRRGRILGHGEGMEAGATECPGEALQVELDSFVKFCQNMQKLNGGQ